MFHFRMVWFTLRRVMCPLDMCLKQCYLITFTERAFCFFSDSTLLFIIAALMKEPVLQDKRQEHVKFCKYATELIEKVSGKQTHKYSDATLEDIRKVGILASLGLGFRFLRITHKKL